MDKENVTNDFKTTRKLPQFFIVREGKDEIIVNTEGFRYARYAGRLYPGKSTRGNVKIS